ncbi:N-formylmethionyl-tRNA deformylase [Rivularia sp. PCC 7116]|uniref:peptide deformylase n=1 Tax=Rivularia sp. PCC 7116 TaxID=373994 RepID=UPI00029F1B38|nr:peptide deformylase [Rivularia sp. PCC 7116]AFY59224.1 N-formylmethionyl-tRNA deformylase [Rivularia sp. PCC 7116]
MSKKLSIIELGNPILRRKAEPVNNIQEQSIQKLIDDLLETVVDANGVGIAAPQVAQSYRVFIVASRPNLRYPNAPLMEPTAMINPRIIDCSDEMVKGWEGCLSIPGIRGLVPRHRSIKVAYTDRDGNLIHQELTEFVARIFQHEYDHFEGLVFLDRVESTLDIATEQEYQNLMFNKL